MGLPLIIKMMFQEVLFYVVHSMDLAGADHSRTRWYVHYCRYLLPRDHISSNRPLVPNSKPRVIRASLSRTINNECGNERSRTIMKRASRDGFALRSMAFKLSQC
jgi:hypothetical protein